MKKSIISFLLLSLLLFTGCKANIDKDKVSIEGKEGKVNITDKEFQVKSSEGYETKITNDKFEIKSKDGTKVEITNSGVNIDIKDE